MRHRFIGPPSIEANTISLPSLVQTGVPLQALSKVSLRGVPPVIGTRKRSLPNPPTLPRSKTTWEPSGEKAGSQSNSCCGGVVCARTPKSSSEISAIRTCAPGVSVASSNANNLPSGDQSRRAQKPLNPVDLDEYSLFSAPPRAGITLILSPSFIKRKNAICRLSGDHAGQQTPGFSVRRRGLSPSIKVV